MAAYTVNLLAVIVATAIGFGIGFVWYSPMVFGKLFMKLLGKGHGDFQNTMKKQGSTPYLMAIAVSFLLTFVLAVFVNFSGARTATGGALIGIAAAIGFIATSSYSSVLWEKRPVGLWVLSTIHMIISMAVMGAILAVWG